MKWNDEYWPLLIRLYLKKPEGVKPLYSRQLVEIALNLHIDPPTLYKKMHELRTLATPSLRQMFDDYSRNPRLLSKAVKAVQQKQGYGTAGRFFDGVEVCETFERDFRPLESNPQLTPLMLTAILDLYFRLTPLTMNPQTEEVQELARLMKISAQLVADVMEVFQFCDPCLKKNALLFHPLFSDCEAVWQRYGNGDPVQLASHAAQIKEFFK